MTTCSSGDYPGDGGAIVPGSGAFNFLEHSGDCPYSNEDLYELVWKAGITTSSSSHRPDVLSLPVPPSEDDMAMWIYSIITGGNQDRAGDDNVIGPCVDNQAVMSKESNILPNAKRGKTMENMATDNTNNSSARMNAVEGATRSAHSRTEKIRRSKINNSLKTLKQLIPGCGKDKPCSQAFTLDQTIQYINSLQRQIQAMSVAAGSSMNPAAAATPMLPPVPVPDAAPGVVQVRPGLVLGPPPPMIPFAP